MLSVGIGLSVNNAKAVLEALLGIESEFTRTPEVPAWRRAGDEWRQKRYRGSVNFVPFVELLLGLYFTVMAFYAATNGIYGTLPFILLFQAGFLYAAALSLFQNVGKLDAGRASRRRKIGRVSGRREARHGHPRQDRPDPRRLRPGGPGGGAPAAAASAPRA